MKGGWSRYAECNGEWEGAGLQYRLERLSFAASNCVFLSFARCQYVEWVMGIAAYEERHALCIRYSTYERRERVL